MRREGGRLVGREVVDNIPTCRHGAQYWSHQLCTQVPLSHGNFPHGAHGNRPKVFGFCLLRSPHSVQIFPSLNLQVARVSFTQ